MAAAGNVQRRSAPMSGMCFENRGRDLRSATEEGQLRNPTKEGQLMELVKYEAMKIAIAECHTMDEAKNIRDKSEALAVYAKQIQDRKAEIQFAEIRLRAERRFGEISKEIPRSRINEHSATPPNGERQKVEVLESLGVSTQAASRYEKLAQIPEEKIESIVASAVEAGELKLRQILQNQSSGPHVTNNSGENEWYTPAVYLDAARHVMGGIDLDPASCALANETVRAAQYFTKEDSGLSHRWDGAVWLNPPYAQPLIGQFVDKLRLELPNIDAAITLTNNATETTWGQSLIHHCQVICFPAGRIKFIDKTGAKSGAPLQGQMICYFGADVDSFTSAFCGFGQILHRW